MRIVFFFAPYLCILPLGREIFARAQSYSTDCFGGIRVWRDPHFPIYTPYTPYCIAPTKPQARLGRSWSNIPHTPRRIVAGYPKSSNSRSLSTAL